MRGLSEGVWDMRAIYAPALVAARATFAGSTAMAGKWAENHPRRAEVNARLNNQNRRINNELKNGEITKQQATALHHQDNQIRQEERDMASRKCGHMTKAEQGVLNQQENKV